MSLGVQGVALLIFEFLGSWGVDIVAGSAACASALGVAFRGLLLLSFLLGFGLGREPWLTLLAALVPSGAETVLLPSRADWRCAARIRALSSLALLKSSFLAETGVERLGMDLHATEEAS